MYITFILNRYKKYYTIPEVYINNEIYNTVVTRLKQSVNRVLAKVLINFNNIYLL